MNDEDEELEESAEVDPEKWSWVEFYGLAFHMLATYCKLWGVWFDGIGEMLTKHAKWKDSREEFAKRAALEIEALTKDLKGEKVGVVSEPGAD